jgi:hypothetical protein
MSARTYAEPVPGGDERFNTLFEGRFCSSTNPQVCEPSDDQVPYQALYSPDGTSVVMVTSAAMDDGAGLDRPAFLQGAPDADLPEVETLTHQPLPYIRLFGWSDAAHPWATS